MGGSAAVCSADGEPLALAHSDPGAVLFRQDNISGAERAYREADRLEPEDARALTALCRVLAHGGQVNDRDGRKRSLAARFPREGEVACCRVRTGSLELWAP